jgi:polyphenol oxidase
MQEITMQQVHGNRVEVVETEDSGRQIPDCDGLITTDPNLLLSVRVADCLPILITDKKGRFKGIIHAGWRGLDNGIIFNFFRVLKNALVFENEDLLVNIGPHICWCHYEIGPDVGGKFTAYPMSVKKKEGKFFLDLAQVAKEQFTGFGVKNINISKVCTFEGGELYSFRKDGTDKRNYYKI